MLPQTTPLSLISAVSDTALNWLPIGHIVVAVLSFGIGLVIGWHLAEDVDFISREHLRRGVAFVVTVVWATSVLADILLPTYSTPLLLYGIMGAVAGFLFSDDGLTVNIGKR